MNSRTIRDFSVSTNIWPVVEQWAAQENFRLLSDRGSERSYQKGYGMLVLPTKLVIGQANGAVHVETWIQSNILNRIMTLFLTPMEMKLDSGGFLFSIPRRISRNQISSLMVQLSQPTID